MLLLLFFGGEAGCFGGEASPLPPPMDRTLSSIPLIHQKVLNLNFELIVFTAGLSDGTMQDPVSGGQRYVQHVPDSLPVTVPNNVQ